MHEEDEICHPGGLSTPVTCMHQTFSGGFRARVLLIKFSFSIYSSISSGIDEGILETCDKLSTSSWIELG